MLRRNFLRGSLALAGGLVVGDEVLEAFARLTHRRKSFPSAWPGQVIGTFATERRGSYWRRIEVSYRTAKILRSWVRDQWGREATITNKLLRRVRLTEVMACGPTEGPGYSRFTVRLT